MFDEYQIVKLKHDVPSADLKAGAVGTVVMVYPELPQAYEVEFADEEGVTLALLTLNERDLVAASPSDQH